MENTVREKNDVSDASDAKMKHANVDASAVMIHQITGSTIKIRKVSTANAAHRAARCIKREAGRQLLSRPSMVRVSSTVRR